MSDSSRLHFGSLVVDAHCDTVLRVIDGGFRLREENSAGHVDLPRLRKGGVGLQFFALYVGPQFKPDRSTRRVLGLLDAFYGELDACQDQLHLVLEAKDVEKARAQGKVGALLSIEGGEALEGDMAVLRMLHRLGVRAIGLTWNQRNEIGDGVGEPRAGGGLTEFGIGVIKEMNRLGMIIDVSHLTERGLRDCLEYSKHPLIASHSNARAVCDHVRNLSDEAIRGLAAGGGVMGINMASDFLVTQGQASLDDVVAHIDHITELVGTDHVGIGADFDGITLPPRELPDVSCLPRLTEALTRRGYGDDDIRKVLGGNFMRVVATVLS